MESIHVVNCKYIVQGDRVVWTQQINHCKPEASGCVLYRHVTAAGSSAISSYTSGFFSFCSRLGSTRKKTPQTKTSFFLSQMSILLIPRVCLCVENLLSRYSCKFGPKCHTDRKPWHLFKGGKGVFWAAQKYQEVWWEVHILSRRNSCQCGFPWWCDMMYPNTGAKMDFIAETFYRHLWLHIFWVP